MKPSSIQCKNDILSNRMRRIQVIMSDVLYYEPHLSRIWNLLPRLICDGGSVVIRVPNKLPLIKFFQFVRQLTVSRAKRDLQSHIKHFNPEHIYVFSQSYLLSRLRHFYFSQSMAIPSELLVQGPQGEFWQVLCYRLAKALATLSHGRIIVTPSFLVMAKKNTHEKNIK